MSFPLRLIFFTLALALALVAPGCKRHHHRHKDKDVAAAKADKPAQKPVTRPVLLFGLDGATWKMIDPLLAAGRLPNFAKLIAAGARAPLKTYKPTLSPLIWTTIATGMGPKQHGIDGFVAPIPGSDQVAIVTSNMRRVKALWNILSDQMITVGIVGWWATYPAEPVNGFIVSDQANDLRRSNYLRAAHMEVPDEKLAARDPRSISPPRFAPWFDKALQLEPVVTGEELGRFFELPKERADLLTQPVGNDEDVLSIFKFAYLIDKSFIGAALTGFERLHPQFGALYLNGLDAAEHHFWKYMQPEAFKGVPKKDVARYKDVIRNYYVYMDGVLGEVLEKYPLDTSTVIVVSDHGHGPNPAHDPKSTDHFNRVCSGTHEDAPDGVLIIAGKDVVRGADLSGASVFDVAPTVLELLGAPVGEDMPGRVLEKAIEPGFLSEHPIHKVPALTARSEHSDTPIPSMMNDALKEKLRGLGYIK